MFINPFLHLRSTHKNEIKLWPMHCNVTVLSIRRFEIYAIQIGFAELLSGKFSDEQPYYKAKVVANHRLRPQRETVRYAFLISNWQKK